ncbi:MAG: amino acid permease [Chlamydiae bacterium]|nr:amino acid permease [Chlamydiota bacterium]
MFQGKKKFLTGWMIALINVAAVCNIKNFPLLAEYGLSIILFLFLSALFFFVPVAFVSAELASAWPDRGVYTWVKEAFGPKMGFLAIWLQWIENVIWYPTVLSFIAGTFAYIINPQLATNPKYVLAVILITFWGATFLNFLGMRVSGWVSSITALCGTIVPIALIIILGGVWIFADHQSQISFSWSGVFPNLTSINQLVLLSGILLGLAGLEMSAVHARDVQNPRHDYPKGIFYSTSLILLFSVLGALAIGAIVPTKDIELASSSMEAFRLFFNAFNIPWATPVIATVTFIGALGMMSTWIVGPSRGILATAEDGDLPAIFHKVNQKGMPVNILIAQAIVVSILSLLFLFMPSVNSSYWALVALASILYQIMYIIMFIAAIRLRRRHPQLERPYRVPFGKPGIWIIGGFGVIGSFFGFFFGFFPPSQFPIGTLLLYETFLIGGTILFCGLPFLIFSVRKPSWRKNK